MKFLLILLSISHSLFAQINTTVFCEIKNKDGATVKKISHTITDSKNEETYCEALDKSSTALFIEQKKMEYKKARKSQTAALKKDLGFYESSQLKVCFSKKKYNIKGQNEPGPHGIFVLISWDQTLHNGRVWNPVQSFSVPHEGNANFTTSASVGLDRANTVKMGDHNPTKNGNLYSLEPLQPDQTDLKLYCRASTSNDSEQNPNVDNSSRGFGVKELDKLPSNSQGKGQRSSEQ